MEMYLRIDEKMAEMTEAIQCSNCKKQKHVSFDASFVLQEEPASLSCPHCEKGILMIDVKSKEGNCGNEKDKEVDMRDILQCPGCHGHISMERGHLEDASVHSIKCPYCGTTAMFDTEGSLKTNTKLVEFYGYLYEHFENYRPDEIDEDEDGEEIEELNPQTETEYKKAVELLVYYLQEWFPDDVDEEEKLELLKLLDEAEGYVKQMRD